MERLTESRKYYDCEFMEDGVAPYMNKLAAYEDAEEQGRLVVLPCKVGETVFVIERSDKWPRYYCVKASEPIKSFLVSEGDLDLNVEAISEYWYGGECGCLEKPEGIDCKYYYTREEAEKALEGMKNG